MKKLRYILKGILLWSTAISIFIFLAGGMEAALEDGYRPFVGLWLILNLCLIYACYMILSYKELYQLSGIGLFDKLKRRWENAL